MFRNLHAIFARSGGLILPMLSGPPIVALLPALTLGAYWLGGEAWLTLLALGLPLLVLGLGLAGSRQMRVGRDSVTGLLLRDGFSEVVAQIHTRTGNGGLKSACFAIEVDGYREMERRHGQAAADEVMQRTGERILGALRKTDSIARLGDSRFGVCLAPVRQLDLENAIQIAARVQGAIEEPVLIGGIAIYVSASVGLCLRSRAPGPDGAAWQEAAAAALEEATQAGPSSIRSYSVEMARRSRRRTGLREDAAAALDAGQIQAWYQPQISTSTGKISGFEALARWSHPVRGLVAPDQFLPALEEAGLMERLGQTMLYHSLTALKAWDGAGLNVPRVGVNFSQAELRDPDLVDRIRWELDRFGLAPERLCVEILESVITDSPDDMVARNVTGLGELGCCIDLDDYGTGHASIAALRRFRVSRIKIDRSFVMKSDRDPEQQRLVGAVLTMAERLGVETLAEGVETVGEHALLAQLGCDHVQGFGIARPMPFEQTLDWMARHDARIGEPPRVGPSRN